MNAQGRHPVGPDNQPTFDGPAARIGMVRGLPDTYEMSEWSPTAARTTVPHAGWARGEIVRGAQPVFALGPNYPAFDRSDPSTYVGWQT